MNKFMLSGSMDDKFDGLNNNSLWKVLRRNAINEIYVKIH